VQSHRLYFVSTFTGNAFVAPREPGASPCSKPSPSTHPAMTTRWYPLTLGDWAETWGITEIVGVLPSANHTRQSAITVNITFEYRSIRIRPPHASIARSLLLGNNFGGRVHGGNLVTNLGS